MKIEAVASDEVFILRSEGRPDGREDVADDFVQVEARGKKIVAIFSAENLRVVARQTGRSRRTKMREHRHHIGTRARMAIENRMDFAVYAAVNRVDQSIALPAAGMLEEGGRENPLAGRSENTINRIIHATRHHRLDTT